MTFHMSRKIGSVVKAVWNPKVDFDPWFVGKVDQP
jgi:hypothetical protein